MSYWFTIILEFRFSDVLFVDAWQTGFRYRFFLSFLILKDGLARAYTGLGAWEI